MNNQIDIAPLNKRADCGQLPRAKAKPVLTAFPSSAAISLIKRCLFTPKTTAAAMLSVALFMSMGAGVSYAQTPVELTDTDMDGVFTPREGIDQMLNFNAAGNNDDLFIIGTSDDANDYAQSFTSGVSGLITEIRIPVTCLDTTVGDFILTLHKLSDPIGNPPSEDNEVAKITVRPQHNQSFLR